MQEVKRLREECVTCLSQKYLTRFPENATQEQKEIYREKVKHILETAPATTSAPVVVRDMNREYEKLFGPLMDYSEIKKHFNQLVLELEEQMKAKISVSDEPLKLGIQYALTGNYVDFAALKNVDENYLLSLLEHVEEQYPLDEAEYQNVKKDVLQAEKIAYLTDNCGEIALDKLLLEVMQRMNPEAEITVIVRGGNVFNDATMEDAAQVGITGFLQVIDNGNQIAGTWLPECSKESQDVINNADVIFAKGQANFETLRCCGKNIYYLFLCKCDLFAKTFGVPKLTGMLLNDFRMKKV